MRTNGSGGAAAAPEQEGAGGQMADEVQSPSEMREMLDRAIAVGVQKWLQPVFEAMRAAGIGTGTRPTDEEQFRTQRGDL